MLAHCDDYEAQLCTNISARVHSFYVCHVSAERVYESPQLENAAPAVEIACRLPPGKRWHFYLSHKQRHSLGC